MYLRSRIDDVLMSLIAELPQRDYQAVPVATGWKDSEEIKHIENEAKLALSGLIQDIEVLTTYDTFLASDEGSTYQRRSVQMAKQALQQKLMQVQLSTLGGFDVSFQLVLDHITKVSSTVCQGVIELKYDHDRWNLNNNPILDQQMAVCSVALLEKQLTAAETGLSLYSSITDWCQGPKEELLTPELISLFKLLNNSGCNIQLRGTDICITPEFKTEESSLQTLGYTNDKLQLLYNKLLHICLKLRCLDHARNQVEEFNQQLNQNVIPEFTETACVSTVAHWQRLLISAKLLYCFSCNLEYSLQTLRRIFQTLTIS